MRVELVNILCTVVDRKGNLVTTLGQDDFILYEDGKGQTIEHFSRSTDLPLSIALLIDTSASVAGKLKFEQEAAAQFFHTILRPQDKALLIEFDSGVTLVQDFTSDPNLLSRQLHTLRAAGATSMYDALYLVSEEKLIPDRAEQRKTILMISDGDDTSSAVTFEEARAQVQLAGASVYAISVTMGGHFGVSGAGPGDGVLEQLAAATGGRVFYPRRIQDLGIAFREIEQELRSQYSISYRPRPRAPGESAMRPIRISVRGQGLKVRHRQMVTAPVE